MRIRTALTAVVVGTLAAATFAVATPNVALADTGTTGEVAVALDTVDARNGNLVAEPVASVTDKDSAAQTSMVDVAADPTKGVKLKGSDGQSMTVKLPGARKGDRGKKTRSGVVVFDSKADSVNAAVPTDNGVQLWTYIRNRKATEDYRYCAEGAIFTVLPNGGAIGVNRANQPVAIVPPPTATEKKTGKSVATSYKAEDNCLVQHVAHKAKGTSYPVVADPWWIPVSAAAVVAAFTAGVYACGLGYLAGAAWQIFWNGWVWNEVRRAGREGCVEGVVVRFMPIAWFRALIRR